MLVSSRHQHKSRPWVSDRGNGLQIWRVAANILKKAVADSRQGRPASLGVGRGAKTPECKKQLVTKCYTEPRNWTDSLERFEQTKIDMRFETRNVSNLYRTSSL